MGPIRRVWAPRWRLYHSSYSEPRGAALTAGGNCPRSAELRGTVPVVPLPTHFFELTRVHVAPADETLVAIGAYLPDWLDGARQ